ncbi:hypothetical protein P7C73_g4832, partial [Tremellales sp. Uapishka_1]
MGRRVGDGVADEGSGKSLDAFLELKLENERLREELKELQVDDSEYDYSMSSARLPFWSFLGIHPSSSHTHGASYTLLLSFNSLSILLLLRTLNPMWLLVIRFPPCPPPALRLQSDPTLARRIAYPEPIAKLPPASDLSSSPDSDSDASSSGSEVDEPYKPALSLPHPIQNQLPNPVIKNPKPKKKQKVGQGLNEEGLHSDYRSTRYAPPPTMPKDLEIESPLPVYAVVQPKPPHAVLIPGPVDRVHILINNQQYPVEPRDPARGFTRKELVGLVCKLYEKAYKTKTKAGWMWEEMGARILEKSSYDPETKVLDLKLDPEP